MSTEAKHLQLIGRRELAEAFDVSVMTLYRWEKTGYLPPPFPVGPRLQRWRRSTIDAILEKRRLDHGSREVEEARAPTSPDRG